MMFQSINTMTKRPVSATRAMLAALALLAAPLVACGPIPPTSETQTDNPQPIVVSQPTQDTSTSPRSASTRTSTSPITCSTTLSDRMPASGAVIVATTVCKNVSGRATKAGRIRYYFSQKKSHSPASSYLNGGNLTAMGSGDTITIKRNLRINRKASPTQQYVLVRYYQEASVTTSTPSFALNALNIFVQPNP